MADDIWNGTVKNLLEADFKTGRWVVVKNNWSDWSTWMEELKLVECLAKAGKVPFTVKVTKSGGEYCEDDVLEITNVGVRAAGHRLGHAGEITYDFKNKTDKTDHKNWRHDSEARFELLPDIDSEEECCLPEDVQSILRNADFGCQEDDVKALVNAIYRDISKAKKAAV